MRDLQTAALQHSHGRERNQAEKELSTLSKWDKIDAEEIGNMKQLRKKFLLWGLENYLQSLAASDDHDTDVIRFLAIWLAHSDDSFANSTVSKHAEKVPSKKFIPLMNQLSSRLQDSDDNFQTILGDIVTRVCHDHPYHGMYHVFASSKTSGGHDSQAQSRQGAATRIAKALESDKSVGSIWTAVARSNDLYNRMARLKDKQFKQGAKLQMKDFEATKRVLREVPAYNVPPITHAIAIRDDRRYQDVPQVQAFYSDLRVPGGISAPKIVVCRGTDGKQYRQLVSLRSSWMMLSANNI